MLQMKIIHIVPKKEIEQIQNSFIKDISNLAFDEAEKRISIVIKDVEECINHISESSGINHDDLKQVLGKLWVNNEQLENIIPFSLFKNVMDEFCESLTDSVKG